jgi:hypothetical protein
LALRHTTALPTSDWQASGWAMTARSGGVLTGGHDPAGAFIVWLQDGAERTIPVSWPAGFSARLDPLEVLDASGAVVAREGQRLVVQGGYVPADPAEPFMMGRPRAFHIQHCELAEAP